MQNTIQIRSQFLHLRTNIFLNPFLESTYSLKNFNLSPKSPIFTVSPLLSLKTQINKPIICARKSKRRYGSQRSIKVVLEVISILTSNFKILPQPLDLVVQNLLAADERWLRFNPWKRPTTTRRNEKKILSFLVVLGTCVLCLLFGKELRSDLLFGILGFMFFVFALIKEWKRGLKSWIFGLCCVGVFVGLGFRANEGQNWVKEIRVSSCSSSIMEIVRGGKRRGRWAF